MAAIILQFIQFLSILLIAPFLTGLIKKSKALLQGRKGPGLLQPYYDLYKHAHKDSFVSLNASWIFTVTPYIVFAATLTASALIPAFVHQPSYSFTGDLVLIIYLFALSRFFISMAAVDTGSSFGAQGASRDLFISSLAEPYGGVDQIIPVNVYVPGAPPSPIEILDGILKAVEQLK